MILTIRSDKPEAELALYDGQTKVIDYAWLAHRQLAETIHLKIRDLLEQQSMQLTDITGVVLYRGPGSFTGLRIGASVANALADSLRIPIVGSNGESWQMDGNDRLKEGANELPVVPEYGAEPHITKPKH